MPDTKITALAAITTVAPSNDLFPIVDVSDNSMAASGTTKNITVNQLLGAGGIAALSSATISGDLTARTTGLTVNSSGVGIGTNLQSSFLGNSPKKLVIGDGTQTPALTLYGGSANVCGLYFADGTVGNQAYRGFVEYDHNTDSFGLGISGSLAMTLNATGLGVGGAPLSGFRLNVNNGDFRVSDVQNEDGVEIGWSAGAGSGFVQVYNRTTSAFKDLVLNNAVTINTAGNVGIGVTPSAWSVYQNTIQKTYGAFWTTFTDQSRFGLNCYYNGTNWIYTNSNYASIYEQSSGQHRFYTAPSGTAGNAFSLSQAMTLDASGNLLVGTTSTATSSGNGFKVLQTTSGHFDPTVITAQNSSIYSCWDIYSTGGTAGYRFYVTSTGTINAVNTTISAISDARLKENVQDIDVGLGAILALKPRKFDWKEGKGKNIKGDRGFIAQEFEQVFPQLVDEWKDAAPEGEAPYKSVRQDLIPVLVKAIQELTARVQTLETR